jgi:hypothetical protein
LRRAQIASFTPNSSWYVNHQYVHGGRLATAPELPFGSLPPYRKAPNVNR